MEVSGTGTALDGLRIEIPSGAFGGTTRWTVREEAAVQPALPPGVELVGSPVRIRNETGYADDEIRLSLPTPGTAGGAVAAFFYDPGSGTLEVIPPLARGAAGLTVVTRHFSGDRMLTAGGSASAPAAMSGALADGTPPPFGEVVIVVLRTADANISGQVDTGFRPGVDDWEFPNYGSLASPLGFCAGASMTALHHFSARKAAHGGLFGLYDRVSSLWGDNAQGIRLASQAQEQASWENLAGHIWESVAAGAEQGVDWGFVQAASLHLSMEVTGRPQLLAIFRSDGSAGHAIISYASDSGTFSIADPNRPGAESSIEFRNGAWVPFSFATTTSGVDQLYSVVFLLGTSALIPMKQMDTLWDGLAEGTAGNAVFPAFRSQYLDAADTLWRDFADGDTITTAGDSIMVRVLCSQCPYSRVDAEPGERQRSLVYEPGGSLISEDTADQPGGAVIPLEGGDRSVGIQFEGIHVASGGGVEWKFMDFAWLDIRRAPFELSARDSTVAPGEEVHFQAEYEGLGTPSSTLQWDFGDGSAVRTTIGDRETTYTYTESGRFMARAELVAEDGGRLAVDSVAITVGMEAWRGESSLRSSRLSTGRQDVIDFAEALVSDMGMATDAFYIARPVPGTGMEDVVFLFVARGTGSTLEAVPAGPGPKGLEWVVARVPEGTLLGGEHPFTGSGLVRYGTFSMNYEFEATFEDGKLHTLLTAEAVGFPSPYYRIDSWTVRAGPFVGTGGR